MGNGILIRPAVDGDLGYIAPIESASDHWFVNWALSPEGRDIVTVPQPGAFAPPPSGADRAREPGFLLISIDEDGGDPSDVEPNGFVHVLEWGGADSGGIHLEQVSVLPEDQRRGIGRALVQAACDEARRRGYGAITLRTFADVPFNGPFYRSLGFEESEPDAGWLHALVDVEERLGLMRMGRRIQMTRVL